MNCKKCGNQINENSKFCDNCGAPVEEVKAEPVAETVNSDAPTQQNEEKKKSLISKLISACISVAVVIYVATNFLGIGGDVTKEYDNDAGAVISMSLEDFCDEFESAYDDIDKSAKFDDIEISLMDSWDEPTEGTDDSDASFLNYRAEIEESRISASVYDDYVASINIDFNLYDTEDIELASALAISAIMAGGDMKYDYASEIFKNVAEYNVVIYKNGLLFYTSDYGYFVIKAASDSYVQAMNVRGITVNEW